MSDADKSRLGRWSRLKQQKKADAALAETQVAGLTEGPDVGQGTGPAEAPVEPVVDLPPVESLGKDSDYTPFLQEGVPEDLAKAALRRMWRSDPAFNIRDGLDDYDEDFSLARLVGNMISEGASKPGQARANDETAKTAAPEKGVDADNKDTADGEDDVGDGEDDSEAVVADAESGDESGDESGAETADADAQKAEPDTPKEPRKSDVRPPDDAV